MRDSTEQTVPASSESSRQYPDSPVRWGLEVTFVTSFIVLGLALFVPPTREYEWLSVAPLLAGTLVTVSIISFRLFGVVARRIQTADSDKSE